MTRALRAITIALLASPAGCASAESGDPPTQSAAPRSAAPSGSDVDPIARLAGTWVLPYWSGDDPGKAPWGTRMLWEVEGNVLTESNGVATVRYDLERVAPCLVRKKDQDRNSSTYRLVLFDGERLYTQRAGGFDSEDGKYVHVCDSTWDRYVRVERGKPDCEIVEQQLLLSTSTCRVDEHDEHELIIDFGDATPTVLARVGGVWLDRALGNHHESALRFESKQAALDALEGGGLRFPTSE